jgi:hypothetical protein
MTNHATCTRCRHPRPLHDDGTGICKARGCRAGPGHGPCTAFMPAAGRTVPVPAAAAVQVAKLPVRPLMVDVRGAAALLRLGRCSVLELADRGELQRLYYGRALRFAVSDLEDLVERHRMAARSAAGHRQAG